jgi:hypothetical protein
VTPSDAKVCRGPDRHVAHHIGLTLVTTDRLQNKGQDEFESVIIWTDATSKSLG